MDLPEIYNLLDIPTDSTAYVFDIEADGFLEEMTKIHCVWSYEINSKKWMNSTDNPIPFLNNQGQPCSSNFSVRWHLEILQNADYLIGQNLLGYDIPAIQKIYPWFKPKGIIIDTQILSQLIYPNMYKVDPIRNKFIMPLKRKLNKIDKEEEPELHKELTKELKFYNSLYGKHSLKAWGYRLGEYKGTFHEDADWSTWTPEMHEYCKQDVLVNYKQYLKLKERIDRTTNKALWVEHEVKKIITRQVSKGFKFNRMRAQEFYAELATERDRLRDELGKTFKEVIKRETFIPKKNNKTRGYVKGVPFEKIKKVPFNAGSRDHVVYWFKEKYNWEPTEFNPNSGKPKVDGDVLSSLPYPEAKLLGKFYDYQKVIAMLAEGEQAWFLHLTQDDRIHGGVNSMGASTGRMTHNSPNLAQIPSRGDLGHVCRELFVVPKGYKLVGCDASGLEVRCLCHYMDDENYTKMATADGADIHSINQEIAGLPTRDGAKTLYYALMYGGGNAKLGSIKGGGASVGAQIRADFMENLPKFERLVKRLQKTLEKRDYVKGIDGRRVPIKSAHSALNFLLQGLGALIMKYALVIADHRLQKEFTVGVDYEFVVNVHDEWQVEAREEVADRVGKILKQSIIDAGIFLELNCPLDGEYMVGDNWGQTH